MNYILIIREVFGNIQDENRKNKFFFTKLNQTEMQNNIDQERIYKNEQYAYFNPYNHIFYTCIKFQDFILYSNDCGNEQKGNFNNRKYRIN